MDQACRLAPRPGTAENRIALRVGDRYTTIALPAAADTSWDAFVGWAKRFWEGADFDAQERDYKLVLAEMLRNARQSADASVPERIEQLRTIFTHKDGKALQNVVRWQDYSLYLEWAEASEAEFSRGLSGLWQTDQVMVEFPTPKTDRQWRLTSQGWVGYIPLTPELGISLTPKVPVGNLFRMLEYAYKLNFLTPEGLTDSKSLQELYERLANILAKRVLDRARRGLYRAYLSNADTLPYVRGSLSLHRRLRRPWAVELPCDFEKHTADLEENQILAWTLHRIVRSGTWIERVLPTVRRAYRVLQGSVSMEPCLPEACVGRLYNRLNDDYQPLHALCRFFLEHIGPTHDRGDRDMIPFLVPMARLFELFVAEWLRAHLPKRYMLKTQESVHFGESRELRFQIDLVLYDTEIGRPMAVLDTKYKNPERPSERDVQQVVAYAESKGCREAVLVYPAESHLDVLVGGIRVRNMVFELGGDLEAAGQGFKKALLGLERDAARDEALAKDNISTSSAERDHTG